MSKKGGVIQLDKPLIQPSVPLVLHKPPAKAGAAISVVKHPATTKPVIESAVAMESAPKAEPAAVQQPKVEGEAMVSADPPKARSDL